MWRKLFHAWGLLISTGLGVGYIPKAPGTVGTLWGVVIFFAFRNAASRDFILLTGCLILVSFLAVRLAEKPLGAGDHSCIVIDEVVGYLLSVLGLPFSWQVALLGFILFRVFDIIKPFPIRWLDRNVKGAVGVVLDDLVAGVFANLVLRLILLAWSYV